MKLNPVDKAARAVGAAVLVLAALSITTGASAQQTDLTARLKAAETAQSLDDAGMKPWHLKMAITLFNQRGGPADAGTAGTIEEWWGGPDQYRIVYTTPTSTATVLKNSQGYFVSKAEPSYLEEQLLQGVVHPIDASSDSAIAPTLRPEATGNSTMDCLVQDPHKKGFENPPLGLFPTYCLNHNGSTLMVSYTIGQTSGPTSLGKFEGKDVATGLTIFEGGFKAASERVNELSVMTDPAAGKFDSTEGLTAGKATPLKVQPSDEARLLLASAKPVYPPKAKLGKVTGSVVLNAVIGADGHVRDLSLVSAPEADMAISGALAARRSVYSPYLVNKVAVPVQTTISVDFALQPS